MSKDANLDPLGSPLARSVFEATGEGLLVLDPNGIILAMNSAFATLYEVDADKSIGSSWLNLAELDVRRFDRSVAFEALVTKRALQGERVEGVVQTIKNRATGNEFIALCRAEPYLVDGKMAATTIVVQDVTEATRSAERVQSALSAAEVGTYRSDLVARRVWGDANFARIYGLTLEEVTGGSLDELYRHIPDEDIKRLLTEVEQSTIQGRPHEVQHRVMRPDGARWVLSRGLTILDEQGRPIQRLGSIVDITRQKATEEAFREANEALESAGRVAQEISADVPLERIVQTIMDAATQACGAQFGAFFYNEVDTSGEKYMLYTISGVPREEFSKFPMPRNTPVFGATFSGEGIVRSDDITQDPRYGTMEPFHGMPPGHLPVRSYLAAPVISRSGEVLGGMFYGHKEVGRFKPEHEPLAAQYAAFAAVGIDNSRLYDRVLGISDELERMVEARTDELTQANQDLNDFSYSVAHDLRAPLRAIVSTSRILLEDVGERLAPHERELLDRQATNAMRLARIVDDLLSFAKLAKAEIRKQEFDLSVLGARIGEEVRNHRKTETSFSVAEGMEAYGDPNLIGYALANLIDNAFKFSPNGGTVTVGREDGAFYVRDQGVGFDMAHATKLFVAFERLVDQEAFEGTGVGLANVKRIVERHGGRVWAESVKGSGATFWFTLGSAS